MTTHIRSHIEIILAAGGYRGLADKLGLPRQKVRFWERRKSIPPEYWADVQAADIASAVDLSAALKAKAA